MGNLVAPLISHVTEVSFVVLVVRGMTSDRIKRKCSEKILSTCHFVHHKLYMHRPGIEPELPT